MPGGCCCLSGLTAWMLLRSGFFDGDYRGAAALVYAEPDRADLCDWSVTPYVLLEHARVTKEYARAGRFLQQHAGRIGESATVTLQADPPLVDPGAEHAATVLAQLMEFSGDRTHGDCSKRRSRNWTAPSYPSLASA
ncbi:MAG TPA: hypothetical protein VN325_13610 [Steroidobacteraceae bacterium]|nr:hypothetical protein [Steroidobacteraceae bacterium]